MMHHRNDRSSRGCISKRAGIRRGYCKGGLRFEVQAYLSAQGSQLAVCRHHHVVVLQSWRHRLIRSQGYVHGIIQPSLNSTQTISHRCIAATRTFLHESQYQELLVYGCEHIQGNLGQHDIVSTVLMLLRLCLLYHELSQYSCLAIWSALPSNKLLYFAVVATGCRNGSFCINVTPESAAQRCNCAHHGHSMYASSD